MPVPAPFLFLLYLQEPARMSTLELYRSHAAQAQADADAAVLVNVRERCERAASAWTAMADRAEKTEAMRVGRNA
jgi:hypothetical protein